MSFEQDPTEKADISGADLAIMVDEMQKQHALILQLGFALTDAWPLVASPFISDARKNKVLTALKAFNTFCDPTGDAPL